MVVTVPERTERFGYMCMIASSLGFAAMGVFVKLASQTLPFGEVAFFRSFGGGVLAVIYLLVTREPFQPREIKLLIWRGVLGFSSLMTYFLAVSRLALADAVLLNYTNPFFTTLFAAAALGERLTARTLGCLAVATGGVVLVVGPHGSFERVGTAAALSSAVLAAFAYVTVKRANATNTPLVIVIAFSFVAGLLSLPLTLYQYRAPDLHGWLWLLGAAACGTTAQLLMTYAYRHARASTASILTLLTPLAATVGAYFVFHEVPGAGTGVGGALILGAAIALFVRGGASR